MAIERFNSGSGEKNGGGGRSTKVYENFLYEQCALFQEGRQTCPSIPLKEEGRLKKVGCPPSARSRSKPLPRAEGILSQYFIGVTMRLETITARPSEDEAGKKGKKSRKNEKTSRKSFSAMKGA